MLAPIAPHICEELWRELGNSDSIFKSRWPQYNEAYLANENITIAVQVNGKLRDTFEIKNDVSEEEIKEAALTRELVKKWTADQTIKKIIVVKNKLVNIVV